MPKSFAREITAGGWQFLVPLATHFFNKPGASSSREVGADGTIANVAATISEIERHAISEKEATKKLGTVIFVKGVAAYNEWKNTFTTTP